jgi:hypothetical protein
LRKGIIDIEYKKPYIHDVELAVMLGGSEDRRYSWVKRALKDGKLTRLKRGLYLIKKRDSSLIDTFEIAQQLYGPSYISFESALSYHGWIPEAVYTTTSATTKRAVSNRTSLGMFSYERTPENQFFMGVERKETKNGIYLIASPWKALADYMYVRRKKWESFGSIIEDLRLDESRIDAADKTILKEIACYYDSPRVRRFAQAIQKLSKEK